MFSNLARIWKLFSSTSVPGADMKKKKKAVGKKIRVSGSRKSGSRTQEEQKCLRLFVELKAPQKCIYTVEQIVINEIQALYVRWADHSENRALLHANFWLDFYTTMMRMQHSKGVVISMPKWGTVLALKNDQTPMMPETLIKSLDKDIDVMVKDLRAKMKRDNISTNFSEYNISNVKVLGNAVKTYIKRAYPYFSTGLGMFRLKRMHRACLEDTSYDCFEEMVVERSSAKLKEYFDENTKKTIRYRVSSVDGVCSCICNSLLWLTLMLELGYPRKYLYIYSQKNKNEMRFSWYLKIPKGKTSTHWATQVRCPNQIGATAKFFHFRDAKKFTSKAKCLGDRNSFESYTLKTMLQHLWEVPRVSKEFAPTIRFHNNLRRVLDETPCTYVPDSGTDSGTDSGSDSGTDSGSDSGSDSGTDSGSDSGFGSDIKNKNNQDPKQNVKCDGRRKGPKGKTCFEKGGVGCCLDEGIKDACSWTKGKGCKKKNECEEKDVLSKDKKTAGCDYVQTNRKRGTYKYGCRNDKKSSKMHKKCHRPKKNCQMRTRKKVLQR